MPDWNWAYDREHGNGKKKRKPVWAFIKESDAMCCRVTQPRIVGMTKRSRAKDW